MERDTVLPGLRRRTPRTQPTPDPEFLQMRDRLVYLLREVVPFEGTTRELVIRLLEAFPKLEWLRDPQRVGPFAKTLEAQRTALNAAGIDLSIERNRGGPDRIRMIAVPEANGARFASTKA